MGQSDQAPLCAAPVVEGERLHYLDVLRGVALMGVLMMNMQAFAMPFSAYMNPTSYGDNSGLNFILWCINHILADAKFITIFSMLFGAGVVLMTSRAEARSGRSAKVHYRRMFWLMIFGVTHAVLLWYGDILFTYSLCGLILFLFRRRRPWILITVGVVLALIPAFLMLGFPHFIKQAPEEDLEAIASMWAPSAEHAAEQEQIFRGDYTGQVKERFKVWKEMFGFILIYGPRILGVMLVGMALFKTGVITGARSTTFYRALLVLGFGGGIPLTSFGIYQFQACDWDMMQCMGPRSLYNYFGSLLSAFGWIGLVMLLCKTQWWPGLRTRFAAVGQMAFTNYIMHSVISTLIFYGHGFGQFGQFNRVGQLGVIVAIAALQLWYSPLWLQRFRFGPLEWLWRTLGYWRVQQWRRD